MPSRVQAARDFAYDKEVGKEQQKRDVEEKKKEQQRKKARIEIEKKACTDAQPALRIGR